MKNADTLTELLWDLAGWLKSGSIDQVTHVLGRLQQAGMEPEDALRAAGMLPRP